MLYIISRHRCIKDILKECGLTKKEEMLRKISSWWLGMIRVVQAARAAAFAIGLLVLIDAAAVAQPAAQGPPAVG